MKKFILVLIVITLPLILANAKEYSYLDPPTISVMDFEVTVGKMVIRERDREPIILDKEYLGKLINHTLVTVLIEKNASNSTYMEEYLIAKDGVFPFIKEDRKFPMYYTHYLKGDELKREQGWLFFPGAVYFPTLLKIYDKKYVEMALEKNNYQLEDLYEKNAEAFSFGDLDFVVLGNVFEAKDYIGVNVRVLNTYRGEELYSYKGFISKDLANLHEVCGEIAEDIIIDILKNYCCQFIVKKTDKVAGLEDFKDFYLFCQSRQVRNNENAVIPSNDTHKRLIHSDLYYWILPGDYIITVYDAKTRTIREISFTINPREIKFIPLEASHFEVETGSITIGGIFPVDSYNFEIIEKQKDAEYIWEIGEMYFEKYIEEADETQEGQREHDFTFTKGEFYPPAGEEEDEKKEDEKKKPEIKPVWSYKTATNEIVVTKLSLAKYAIKVSPVAEAISKESITGIAKVSSRQIEAGKPIDVNLKEQKNVVLNIEDFQIRKEYEVESYQIARVSIFFHPAFSKDSIKIEEKIHFGPETKEGFILLREFEKLILEDEFSEDEWNALTEIDYTFKMKSPTTGVSLETLYPVTLNKTELEAKKDTFVIVDFEQGYVLVDFKEKVPIEEEKLFVAVERRPTAPRAVTEKKPTAPKPSSLYDLLSKRKLQLKNPSSR